MIDSIVTSISEKLKNRYPRELPSVNIIRYVLKFVISNLIPICIFLTAAYVFNVFKPVIICIGGFALLRFFSGGIHLKSVEKCFIGSLVIILIIITSDTWLKDNNTYILNSITLLIVLLFAPSRIKNQTRIKAKYYPLLKLLSAVIAVSAFFINENVLTMAFFIQSLTLIHLKGGDKYEKVQ